MEIQGYKLMKNDDDYTLVVFVETGLTEFASEFGGHFQQEKKDLNTQIRVLVKEKFPHLPIKVAKVLAGSMLITTFYLGTNAPNVGAQTISGQTQTVNDMYTVKAGDTLYSIAMRYNVSVDSIKKINGLASNMLFVGQQLRLPFFTYTVTSGDTLYSIAKRYNTTVDQIRTTNSLKSDMLMIGQKLRIPQLQSVSAPKPAEETVTQPAPTPKPVEETVTPPPPTTKPVEETVTTPAPTPVTATYTVVAGDTLYGISTRFGTTVDELKSLNNLTSNVLSIGQVLKVSGNEPETIVTTPAPTPVTSTYTVVAGDTLYSISVRFGTTIGAIQAANNLTTTNLSIGQVLTIPGETTVTKEPVPTEKPAPDVPTVTLDAPTLVHTQIINSQSAAAYPVKGTAEPASRVQITFFDGVNAPITTEVLANEKGEFSAFVSLGALRDGPVSITTKAVDSSGNESGLTKLTVKKDTTVEAPIFQELRDITGQNAANYTFAGTAEPNATITIRATDGVNPAAETTVTTDVSGAFQTALNLTGLNDGAITITATTTDEAQNSSSPAQVSVTKDSFVGEPVLDPKQTVNTQNANSYTLLGMADPGATVQIVLSDGVNLEITVEAVANENGEFRTSIDLRTLNDGEIFVTASAIDEHANRSRIEQATLIKETALAPPVINNTEMINGQTATSYHIFGMAQPGTTVDITVSDGVNPDIIASTTANENGEYNAEVDVSALLDTSLTISAFQTSAAGVTSNVSDVTVEKDTKAPIAPIFTNNHFITGENQTTYELIGKAEANTDVQIRIFNGNGQVQVVNATTNENGEYRVPVDLTAFSDGDLSFELTQVDRAGNVSPAVTKTLVKDTVGPKEIQLETPLPIFSDNVLVYPIRGVVEPHSTVVVEISDGVNVVSKTVGTSDDGRFEKIFDLSTLKDGELTATFRATDNAGNAGETRTLTFEKDTTAPGGVVTTQPNYVNQANQSNFTITGSSVEEGATVEMVVSDGTTTVRQTAKVVNGAFSANLNLSGLKDGPLTFEARQTDRAGNRSIVEALTLVKDTVVENAAATKNGFRYENMQYIYTVIGTAEANAKVEVSLFDADKNVIVTRIANADENGFYSVDVYVDKASKVASASVTQTDQAGNTSGATNVSLSSYTVTQGDTLYSVAKRYNTTVDSLMTLNNLTSDVLQPNQTLRLPITASEVVNLGYMYFGNTKEYVNTVNSTGHAVNIVSPSYFDINPDGTLKLTYQVDPNFIETMHRQGIRVVPFLSNHWNRDVGRAMLANKELAAQQIADAIARYNLDGVNVDIENVTDADRTNYTEFVRLLREKIPPTKEVSVAVAANPNGWTSGWHGSYDYANLAKYADYLMIMAYDESYQGGNPGSVASYSWVEKSIQYALAQDVAPDKVVLGIAHFGRYWMEGQSYGGYGISNTQVQTLIDRYNGTVVFDEVSKTPKATITIKAGDPVTFVNGTALSPGTYTIWFENDESIQEKLELVGKYNIRGVGNWSIGQENKSVWNSYTTTLPNTVPVVSPVYTGPIQNYKTYTVVAGDTLWGVANRNDTTVSELKEANGLTSDSLYVGQVLRIPTDVAESVVIPPPAPSLSTPAYTVNYTVAAGDTLSRIASINGTTVTAIKNANNLTSDMIYVGQVLKVPTNVVVYTVASGDTLYGIANRYNTTVANIKTVNNLTSDILSVGQTLKIQV
ncbi:LysM peptidoglycan-binding domain-containing protein [Bacillus sp. REN16]|uniref:LysM peptidoglycan-binding domain-containing protein n=1 Tax=Bacillus sp. REN16 TaxID=2887296 RepID=UPI001E45D3C6|nr:LysM peptidoglycan-binding domain-containing protein [Bacillus sp. REN16]MCC3356160.1 LysM peptidoglycan-binding domain-containing protein [Bacillus sp. REN16]